MKHPQTYRGGDHLLLIHGNIGPGMSSSAVHLYLRVQHPPRPTSRCRNPAMSVWVINGAWSGELELLPDGSTIMHIPQSDGSFQPYPAGTLYPEPPHSARSDYSEVMFEAFTWYSQPALVRKYKGLVASLQEPVQRLRYALAEASRAFRHAWHLPTHLRTTVSKEADHDDYDDTIPF